MEAKPDTWLVIWSDGSSLLTTLEKEEKGGESFLVPGTVAIELPADATNGVEYLFSGINVMIAQYITRSEDGAGFVGEWVTPQCAREIPLGSVVLDRIAKRWALGEIVLEAEALELGDS